MGLFLGEGRERDGGGEKAGGRRKEVRSSSLLK